MVRRRQLLAATGAALVAGCGSGSDGATPNAGSPTDTDAQAVETSNDSATGSPVVVGSSAFDDGGTIPRKYTGVGEDVSPPLTVESVPADAETLAIVLDDPDANGYLHWLIWNIPADRTDIPEGVPPTETVDALGGARQGTNDFGEIGYRGPFPPEGDGAHTYRFTVYAVDTTLDLAAGAGRGDLESALDGGALDRHLFTGEFER